MSRPGRDFELLVARIEGWLVPKGAIVKSPDRIPDKDTGSLREVDASIRHQVGSSMVLIILECRERQEKQDVCWIEGLVSKRESVGADKIIAVSSSDFTDPAKEKAEAKGIELRLVNDITKEKAVSWVDRTKISFRRVHWKLDADSLHLSSEDPNTLSRFAPNVLISYEEDRINTPIGRNTESSQSFTIRYLVNHATQAGKGIADDLVVGAKPVRKTIQISSPNEELVVFTESGEKPLKDIRIPIIIWMTEVAARPRVLEYGSPKEAIIQVAEAVVCYGSNRALTVLYSNTPPKSWEDQGSSMIDDEKPARHE